MTGKLNIKISSSDFRVPPDKKVNLGKWPTKVEPYAKSKKQYKELLDQHIEKLSSQQQLHYASHRYALLLIFQGMDGAGKDGAIRHVMSGVNPEGCEVFSFKQPSAEELDHDFLWRTTCRLPERGQDRHLQPLVLRGSAAPSGTSDSPQTKSSSRTLRRENIWKQRL